MVTLSANPQYMCKSTDSKPAEAEINTLLLELDTGDFYYFDTDETWKKVGAGEE